MQSTNAITSTTQKMTCLLQQIMVSYIKLRGNIFCKIIVEFPHFKYCFAIGPDIRIGASPFKNRTSDETRNLY